ncbi:MAG TPA: hypothetical protein DEB40_13710 [Elusimicrobia bacterium]|nr:hypothetical protein [Elusimicrobiota bacterium]HBT62790.1 hypothetical protein [Elusimicrobiota bacterium]
MGNKETGGLLLSGLRAFVSGLALLALAAAPGGAQIDPEKRQLVHAGYDLPLSGVGPPSAYLFYYRNQPRFLRPDLTLRFAAAPAYLDSELGVEGVFGGRTDVGLGLAGGGFAESYAEVRGGQYLHGESFIGNSAAVSLSAYRRLDPGWRIPLNGVLRLNERRAVYERRVETAPAFALPPDHLETCLRAGLRLGGAEPELEPARSAELSVWYEGVLRDHEGTYGFAGDRRLRRFVQNFWTRARASWTSKTKRRFEAAIESGSSRLADRLSAYRLGGVLPFASEFPLMLPGYYGGELSARRYVLMSALAAAPVGAGFSARLFAGSANVTFVESMGQPRPWNSGAGAGLGYASRGGVWRADLNYAYGIDALRSGGRGAHAVSLLAQIDIEAWKRLLPAPTTPKSPSRPEGMEWIFQRISP